MATAAAADPKAEHPLHGQQVIFIFCYPKPVIRILAGDQYEGSFKDDQRHGTGTARTRLETKFQLGNRHPRCVEEEEWRGVRDGVDQRRLCAGE